jgi:hypothetical protein
VPRGHVPEQNRARLQSCDLAEQPKYAAPLSAFPRHVRLHKKNVSNNRAKSTEGRDKTELPNLLSKIEIELDAAKMFLSMNGGEFAFDGQFCGTEHKHDYEHEYQPSVAAATYGLASETRHNSFPEKTNAASNP